MTPPLYRIRIQHSLALMAALGLFGVPAFAATHGYTYLTVDAPGAANVQATQINNSGLITQQYQGPVPPGSSFTLDQHSAVFTGGHWTVIDVPGAGFTGNSTPNSEGQIILTYGPVTSTGDFGSFAVWRAGKTTLLDVSVPGYQIGANALNNRGQIAAYAMDASGQVHGLAADVSSPAASVYDYPAPNVIFTQAGGINSSGTTVGNYATLDDDTLTSHGFVKDGNSFVTVDFPGAADTGLTNLNDRGDIVGVHGSSLAETIGFVGSGGVFTDLSAPGAVFTFPQSINNHGQISGFYVGTDGVAHGFVATSVHGKA